MLEQRLESAEEQRLAEIGRATSSHGGSDCGAADPSYNLLDTVTQSTSGMPGTSTPGLAVGHGNLQMITATVINVMASMQSVDPSSGHASRPQPAETGAARGEEQPAEAGAPSTGEQRPPGLPAIPIDTAAKTGATANTNWIER